MTATEHDAPLIDGMWHRQRATTWQHPDTGETLHIYPKLDNIEVLAVFDSTNELASSFLGSRPRMLFVCYYHSPHILLRDEYQILDVSPDVQTKTFWHQRTYGKIPVGLVENVVAVIERDIQSRMRFAGHGRG